MFGYVSPKGAAGLRASTAQKRRLLSTICRSSLNPGLCHNLPKRVRALSEAISRERVANEHQQKRAPNVLAAYQPSDRPAHCDCLRCTALRWHGMCVAPTSFPCVTLPQIGDISRQPAKSSERLAKNLCAGDSTAIDPNRLSRPLQQLSSTQHH